MLPLYKQVEIHGADKVIETLKEKSSPNLKISPTSLVPDVYK